MNPIEATDLFYQEIPAFSDFHDITDERQFHSIPDDWSVVITDVKGSTKAIESGRYKDVNTVGAASIAAVQNTIGDLEYPFVFGGDGATLIIPPCAIEDVKNVLGGLKSLSQSRFGLPLRVGVVPMSELKADGIQVQVAKYQLIGKKSIALFTGGGLTAAEEKVKGKDGYEVPEKQGDSSILDGLSCRWKPIPSRVGKILSFLAVARSSNPEEVYSKVLSKLSDIFNGKMESANPVSIPSMSHKSFFQCIRDERRYYQSIFNLKFFFRLRDITLCIVAFRLRIPPIVFDSKKYHLAIPAHSDYRKFDDALRMVLDCSEEQISQLRTYLEELYQSGELFYGLHESPESLMTCYVNDTNDGNHIHFIDGGDGGYAIAAKQLKGQMKSA